MDEKLETAKISKIEDSNNGNINFAHFFHSIRDDELPLSTIKNRLEQNFPLVEIESSKIFNLLPEQKMVFDRQYYLAPSTNNHIIEIYFGLTQATVIFGAIWRYERPETYEIFLKSALPELEIIKKSFSEELRLLTGETSVFLVDETLDETEMLSIINQFDVKTEEDSPVLVSATSFGTLKHMVPNISCNRFIYFLEKNASVESQDLTDFVIDNLLKFDYTIHGLRRKILYFKEKRETINSEKADIDRLISGILHKQIVSSSTDEKHSELEAEVDNLSKMYGLLATNLHMLEEAATTITRDLNSINEIARSQIFVQDQERSDEEIFQFYKNRFTEELKVFSQDRQEMRLSLESAKAALGIIRARVDLFRGNETMALQKQTRELLDQNVNVQKELVALQVAAGAVEFVIIFYYVLKSWEAVVTDHVFNAINPVVKISLVALFSASTVSIGHFLAESIKHKKAEKRLFISVALIVVSLIIIFIASILS